MHPKHVERAALKPLDEELEQVAAAAHHLLCQRSAASEWRPSQVQLELAIEGLLRTSSRDTPGKFSPAEIDGVVFLEVRWLDAVEFDALGFAWLVSNQQVVPLRGRFRAGRLDDVIETFCLRVGIKGMMMPRQDLERIWRRGRFPSEDFGWTYTVRWPAPGRA